MFSFYLMILLILLPTVGLAGQWIIVYILYSK